MDNVVIGGVQLDEDEKYLAKLEAGLYTLQVSLFHDELLVFSVAKFPAIDLGSLKCICDFFSYF